jgi:hypothetical protein
MDTRVFDLSSDFDNLYVVENHRFVRILYFSMWTLQYISIATSASHVAPQFRW